MAAIGRNIRAIREKCKITQDELAAKLFVSRQTVSNYETGKSKPDIDMLIRISEVLEVDVQYLLYGTHADKSRRSGKRGFITSCIVLAIIAVICAVMQRLGVYARAHYMLSPTVLLKLILSPCLAVVIGLSVIQGIALVPKVTIPRFNAKYARIIVLAVMIAYLLLILPFCVGALWTEWQVWRQHLNGAQEVISGFYIPVVSEFARFVYTLNDALLIIFGLLGAILWLTGGSAKGLKLNENRTGKEDKTK